MKPGSPNTLIAGVGSVGCGGTAVVDGRSVSTGGVYLTEDGGATWTSVLPGYDNIGAVEFCEQNPQIAYAAGSDAVWRSDDGGHTWQKFQDADSHSWGPDHLKPGGGW